MFIIQISNIRRVAMFVISITKQMHYTKSLVMFTIRTSNIRSVAMFVIIGT
jgi:hypothetical protein